MWNTGPDDYFFLAPFLATTFLAEVFLVAVVFFEAGAFLSAGLAVLAADFLTAFVTLDGAFAFGAGAVFRIWAVWSPVSTFWMISSIIPFSSTTKVTRAVPINLRPYIDFSTQVP